MESSPPLIHAKSLAGDVYTYPVTTATEFKQRLATEYDLAPEWIHLLDPDSETPTIRDTPLQPTTVYALFVDPPEERRPVLLSWIAPLAEEVLNPHLRLENPSYVLTPREAATLAPSQLDYLAMTTPHTTILRPHFPRLTSNGWRRLFTNPAAVPLLYETYDTDRSWHPHFIDHAPLLAMNTHPETHLLLRRILDDMAIGILPPVRRPDLFWRNIARYQPYATELLSHLVGPSPLTHLDHLCENPSAIPFFLPLPLFLPLSDPRLKWNTIIAHAEAAPHFLPLLQQGYLAPPRISMASLFQNPNPCLLPFYRTLRPDEIIPWLDVLARHEDPAFLAFVEEFIPYLLKHETHTNGPLHVNSSLWMALNRNPSPHAIALLRQHPERIHWTLLTTNPSPEVIPMIEAYLDLHEQDGFAPFVSEESVSLLGYSFVRHGIRETYRGTTIWSDTYRTTINLGALSLHPAALPLLEKRPELIYRNSFSVRPDIYITPQGSLEPVPTHAH